MVLVLGLRRVKFRWLRRGWGELRFCRLGGVVEFWWRKGRGELRFCRLGGVVEFWWRKGRGSRLWWLRWREVVHGFGGVGEDGMVGVGYGIGKGKEDWKEAGVWFG
ncbi:uncharacterized protein G2W53_021938 [Senna tora]|uniref:Uncharacterized protein n=1 Tax=Senna tora TaxID=362788 RepID=A0A834TM52_9FABA|nr:uncharacterized protein G2W53_021938 [Senna tora]